MDLPEFDIPLKRTVVGLGWLAITALTWGGPPFVTDDPEPVEYRHWEVYLATQYDHAPDGASGTLPQVEVNYGAFPELQLHVILPDAFDAPAGGPRHFGYGDTEAGAKYRFVRETDGLPQIGVFPLVELPTGRASLGLSSGHTQIFLPVWLQKTFGAWTTYGGTGYWINPGVGNRNWWLTGWVLQREVRHGLTLGAEIFHETPLLRGAGPDTKINAGLVWDLDDTRHILVSGGPTIQGPHGCQAYLALQFTFGPEEKPARK